MDVIKLAKILNEEFEKDNWGDIDPYLFHLLSSGNEDEEDLIEVNALENVLNRVVKRINEQ